MTPQRLSVKFFVKDSQPVDLAPFIPLFHGWIQNNTVDGLLVDVANYDHVPEGPGILLVGHDVDYGLDLTAGRAGLLVRRKRYGTDADLSAVARDTFHKAAKAAAVLNADSSANVQLDPATVEITLIDRLRTPNTTEALADATAQLKPILSEIYPDGYETRQGNTDPRACLSVVATGKADFDSMVARLAARGE
jgi:hypothetical protein